MSIIYYYFPRRHFILSVLSQNATECWLVFDTSPLVHFVTSAVPHSALPYSSLLYQSFNTRTTRLSKKLVKDNTPSVAWLRRLKALDELTIRNNSGDSGVFHPGDW